MAKESNGLARTILDDSWIWLVAIVLMLGVTWVSVGIVRDARSERETIEATATRVWIREARQSADDEGDEDDDYMIDFEADDGDTFAFGFSRSSWETANVGDRVTAERVPSGTVVSVSGPSYRYQAPGPVIGYALTAFGSLMTIWAIVALTKQTRETVALHRRRVARNHDTPLSDQG